MALITRCPVCATLFRVVPDQLRISEGWVRCGQCAEVFDASGDLQNSDAEHPHALFLDDAPMPAHGFMPEVGLIPEAESKPVPVAPEEFAEHPMPEPEWVPVAEPVWQVLADETPIYKSVTVTEHVAARSVAIADGEPPLVLPEVLAPPVVSVDPVVVHPAEEAVIALETVATDPPILAVDLPLPAAVDAYSFARTSELPVVGRKPWVQGLWMGLACALVLVLGVQAMVSGRDRWAATWPDAKPVLQSLCAPLGCTVQAWRHIESVVIDSSTLTAIPNGDVYRLNMVLKNAAVVDLAMPAVEFVLTDIDEQAVFRRVLTPTELGAASRMLFAGREWATALDVKVTDGPGKDQVVGYRLLAFYP